MNYEYPEISWSESKMYMIKKIKKLRKLTKLTKLYWIKKWWNNDFKKPSKFYLLFISCNSNEIESENLAHTYEED